MVKKIGIITSGGDAPGMNTAIRAVVKAARYYGIETIGIQEGFQGLLGSQFISLTADDVEGFSSKGGTALKTAIVSSLMDEAEQQKAFGNLRNVGIDALIVIGGKSALLQAHQFSKAGIAAIGIPATINNDLAFTDYAIGFDTTMNTVLDVIQKIKDTGFSHDKATLVEVMGKPNGDVALYAAMLGEGDVISTPEKKLTEEEICAQLQEYMNNGKYDNVVIVAENMYDLDKLQKQIEETLQISIRVAVPGFIQRGGSPSAFDRLLANKLGVAAVKLIAEGTFGQAVGVQGNQTIQIELKETTESSTDRTEQYDLLRILMS